MLADVDRTRVVELEAEARASRTIFVGRFDATSTLSAGSNVELSVDTRHLHFFDLETEAAIRGADQAA